MLNFNFALTINKCIINLLIVSGKTTKLRNYVMLKKKLSLVFATSLSIFTLCSATVSAEETQLMTSFQLVDTTTLSFDGASNGSPYCNWFPTEPRCKKA